MSAQDNIAAYMASAVSSPAWKDRALVQAIGALRNLNAQGALARVDALLPAPEALTEASTRPDAAPCRVASTEGEPCPMCASRDTEGEPGGAGNFACHGCGFAESSEDYEDDDDVFKDHDHSNPV
jgi:hypothetical protein